MNIRFPSNVYYTLEVFYKFQFPFIPGVFDVFITEDYIQAQPYKLKELNKDVFFIRNAGQCFTIMILGFLFYLFVLHSVTAIIPPSNPKEIY